MSDKIELGEPDVIRNEDNILWLRAEVERLQAVVDVVTLLVAAVRPDRQGTRSIGCSILEKVLENDDE